MKASAWRPVAARQRTQHPVSLLTIGAKGKVRSDVEFGSHAFEVLSFNLSQGA